MIRCCSPLKTQKNLFPPYSTASKNEMCPWYCCVCLLIVCLEKYWKLWKAMVCSRKMGFAKRLYHSEPFKTKRLCFKKYCSNLLKLLHHCSSQAGTMGVSEDEGGETHTFTILLFPFFNILVTHNFSFPFRVVAVTACQKCGSCCFVHRGTH